MASELIQQSMGKSTYEKGVQSYFYGQGGLPEDEKVREAGEIERAKQIRVAYEASISKFEGDLESLRIFVYTIKEHCRRFCNHHSQISQAANLDFLNEHEEARRQEFLD